MNTFAQTLVSNPPRSKSQSMSSWFWQNIKMVNMITLAVVVVMCGAYIFQVNSSISRGYQIRDLETQIHALTLSNQQMELDVRQAQSLKNVTHAVKMLGLVEAGNPVYVESVGPSYALAK
jgi:cell division protein FtsL